MSEPTQNLKDLLQSATLPERLVSIVMNRGLVAEFQQLEEQLETANEKMFKDRRLGSSEVRTIAERIETLRDQMRTSTAVFRLRALKGTDWRKLKAAHPLTDNPSDTDRLLGAHTDGLFIDAVRKSIIDPVIDDDDWAGLLEVLTDGEWDQFTDAVYSLNEQGTTVPFSRASSAALANNDDG